MSQPVLLVDENTSRRAALRDELVARGQPVLQVKDAFEAMAALGRAEFGCVVIGDARRRLSLRGLCHVARRRHPAIRLCVLLPAVADEASARASLGVPVDIVDGGAPETELAETVIGLTRRPLDPFEEQPSNAQVDQAIAEAYEERASVEAAAAPPAAPEELSEPTVIDQRAPAAMGDTLPDVRASEPEWEAPGISSTPTPTPRPAPGPAVPHEALLEGVLESDTAPALLMGVFAQELTGRLDVQGGAGEGTIYFYKGEPVAADHARGNVGMLEELESRQLVPPNLDIQFVPEGELLATMVAAGNVTGQAMMRFVREFVRRRLLELVLQREGTYRFIEDGRFLDVAALVRINPFGVVLQTRRETMLPPEIQQRAEQLRGGFLLPRPALRLAAEKLRPFAKGKGVDEVVGELIGVEAFWEACGLDDISGTVLVDTLLDARLVELTDTAPTKPSVPAAVELTDSQPFLAVPQIVLADESVEGAPVQEQAESPEEAALREEILSMYVRLKPLSHPRQVLGVTLWADEDAIKAAYRERMKEADPTRVPGHLSDKDALVSRLEELRGKIMRAMEVLQYQGGAAPGSALPALDEPEPGDDNPL
jgi:hypothetical protein